MPLLEPICKSDSPLRLASPPHDVSWLTSPNSIIFSKGGSGGMVPDKLPACKKLSRVRALNDGGSVPGLLLLGKFS